MLIILFNEMEANNNILNIKIGLYDSITVAFRVVL